MVALDPLLELGRLSQAPAFIFSLTIDTILRAGTGEKSVRRVSESLLLSLP